MVVMRLNDFGVSYLKEILRSYKIVGMTHLWVVYVNDELNTNKPHCVVDIGVETIHFDALHIDASIY